MKSSRVLLGMSLVLMFCAAAWAQTGSITGTVKDPSGASIAGASVVITSPDRGITRTMSTNSTGDYNQSALPQGSYDVIVSATGFKKFQAKGVALDVAEKARVDVTLEVGAISTEVIVQGENVAQVETQSSELAGTVTGKEITQLQLNGRNFTTLVTLVPGVSNQTGMDEPQVGINGNVGFSMNGGRTEYNAWELDGGDNMDNGSNSTLNVYPSVDAIAEFKVLTSNYGAQYGRNGSGTVEVETKGGTKSFHGDAYEFVRNDAFNALNYTDMASHGGSGRSLRTRRTTSAIRLAARSSFPACTTRTSRRPSSSGLRNGVATAYPQASTPWSRTVRNATAISAICACQLPVRIAQPIHGADCLLTAR